MSWTLPELIDVSSLQMLMDRFYTATGIPVGIIGSDGTIHVATGWQEICTDFHRCHPVTAERCRQSDDYIKSRLSTQNYIPYKCRNGLWDVAVPIVIAGGHAATLFLGQFIYDDEETDEKFFREQAMELGFPVEGYMAALRRIPVFSREKVHRVMEFYSSLVDFLVSIGLAKHQQAETEKILRETEAKQRQSELHFRATFDQAAVGIAHAGLDGRWLLVNRKLCAILGYSQQDLQSMTYREITHPDDRDISIDWHRKLVAGEVENYSLEKRYIRKDGSFVWVNVSLSQVHSDDGISDYLIAVVEDITARKQTEDALKEREEWYRTLFERANDSIIIVREDRFESCNSKAQELFRCTEEQLLGQTPWRLSPHFQPDGIASAEKAAEKENLALAGSPQLFEWRHRRNDGTLFDAEVNLSRVECQGKGELLAIIRDITERKRVEEALKVSEEEKSLILNSTLDLVIYHDPDMNILWGNQRALDSVGMQSDEIAGRHCWELWHHRNQACPGCPVVLALKTRQPQEAEIRTPDKKAWNIRAFPVKDSEGKVKGVVEFCLDDTKRKRAEEALQQAHDGLERRVAERTEELAHTVDVLKEEIRERQRIEETLKAETAVSLQAMEKLREKDRLLMHQSRQAAMGEMLGNIAHQWRQPLNNIGLLIQELKFESEWGELTQKTVNVKVQKSMELISHMSQTIDDFRNFFKPDKERKPFDVSEVVFKSISLLKGSLESHGIRTIVSEKERPFATGFANEFSQVIINIVNNAKDALILRRTKEPQIVVTVATEGENAVVRIADNAGGVPVEIISRIFDPYFTTKEPDQGTGVGLFMSKRIIENNMNGSLRVTNTGEGAEFTIELRL